jgi:hypothetical protein
MVQSVKSSSYELNGWEFSSCPKQELFTSTSSLVLRHIQAPLQQVLANLFSVRG